MFCQMCLISWYSARPAGPSSVVFALGEPLAGVEGLGAGHGVPVVREQVRDAQQQAAPVPGRSTLPGSFAEGQPGG